MPATIIPTALTAHKHAGAGDGGVLDFSSTMMGTELISSYFTKPMRISADVASINGTKDTTVKAALLANHKYLFMFKLYTRGGAAAPASNYQIHALAAGAALDWAEGVETKNGTITGTGTATAVTTNIFNANATSPTTDYQVFVWGSVTVGANATTIQLDIVDTTANMTVKIGSSCEVIMVA